MVLYPTLTITLVSESPPRSLIIKGVWVFIGESLTKLFLDMMNSLIPSLTMIKGSFVGLKTSTVN